MNQEPDASDDQQEDRGKLVYLKFKGNSEFARTDDYNNAAKKAFIMNRIGDVGFLIALFWMIQVFGSVSFSEVFTKGAEMHSGAVALTGITLLLF